MKGTLILTLMAFAMASFCHRKLTDHVPVEVRSEQLIPSASALKLISGGFEQVLCDFYWLKFVGYIGDTTNLNVRSDLACNYLELITSLDPHFTQAYWFALFTLSADQGNPSRAADILDFGTKNNPDNWIFPFLAGINQHLYNDDELNAAKFFRIASSYPGAPEWLSPHADILEARLPRLLKEAYSWLNIYSTASDERLKVRAKEKSILLWWRVLKNSTADVYRSRARQVLKDLGVDTNTL
ncbi:hypothetical protein KF707_06490 [Candidatus Obscuribacterales bacterium]|nr:hypothetical protein [Candidatus Obscuribacterales bacterium]MBX3135866.1 hypothetical protein [Candidatus Obscuribacterales bacterium]MBX3150643.1 hypothetical protein [Candidatus Obscuribacterales bacterium]